MERILITGALGQLGQEFIKFFNKNNTYVLATDIRSPLKVLSCDFEIADAMDEKRIDYLIKKNNINVVYHLVAVLSANGEKNPFMAWEINMKSFQNIINLSINNGIKKIFWPSSIAVFGTKSNLSFVKQDCILNPNTIYGISKLAGERLIDYYNNKFDLDIRSLRYPGIISFDTKPGGGTTDYIIEMIQSLKNEKEYTCFLNKNTKLPMLYIDDAINGTIKYMSINKINLRVKDAYNITGFSITPFELEKKLNELGCSAKVIYNSDFRQDIADTWPKEIDDSTARKDWGWKFDYGIDKTLKVVFK
ncbi:NAD-dependent epimerase/dehydratase family protein [Flavobacteriaceae bacterium]|jgi:nucleoside-diphosphate-sugar epimerase|nr:NAD-dependent epimerase/dehydratase family protein [Flavobacteriaceae bacterium]MBT7574360.1 NAD-dependent epimerase/dehydratase family protein [Flavobacteriaceae bacterium]MBT7983927.1 NAD-dependent epimerase/dehydratase family protein [Flavobacteriaceae bacterium]MDA7730766.1 NAD-dependent epimerase/dehydratase family protein [Flavobacteriaceae bacterium]MDA9827849.1 NAD-dependent epimerase/dehydratase family protein [Flavobacteriaceae bacterium]